MFGVKAWLLGAAACAVAGASAFAAEPAGPAAKPFAPPQRAARWDPAITRGVLPNGLTYIVAPNASPKGAVSIRLVEATGSFNEDEGERGVAHLIEHLAFRSTRHFANDEVERTLSANGIAFGRDFNAGTGLFGTFFQLDIAKPNPASLDVAFRWLRDIGDGLSFTPADVDSERRVVIAERQQAMTSIARFGDEVMKFEGGALRSVNRSPGGEPSVLQSVTPAQVRAFHDRWYRPSATTVIVTGDVSPAEVKDRLEKAFADWAEPATPARAPPLQSPKPGRKLEILVRSEPGLPDLAVACRVAPPEPRGKATPEQLGAATTTDLWVSILNRRLADLTASHTAPLLNAGVYADDEAGEFRTFCLVTTPTGNAWQAALQASQAEVLRFDRDGPSLAELDQAIEDQRAKLRGALSAKDTAKTAELADALVTDIQQGRPHPDPREAMRSFDLAVEGLDLADIRKDFGRRWRDADGPLLIVNSAKPVTPELVAAAWTGAKVDAGAFQEAKQTKWPYPAAKARGKVVKTLSLQPDFTRFVFDNGLVLNYKKTAFEKNNFDLRISFGNGRSEVPKGKFFVATLASQTFFMGGLGKLSAAEIKRAYPYACPNFKLTMGDRRFIIASSGRTETLDDQLALLGAYLSDPGFRSEVEPMITTSLNYAYRAIATIPDLALAVKLDDVLWPGSEAGLPPLAEVDKLTAKDLADVLKGPVTGEPLEITIVGDLDQQTVLDTVAASLGALPSRHAAPAVRGNDAFLRYPSPPYPVVKAVYAGKARTTVTQIQWPLYVADPARRREEFSLKLLAGVLSERLRHRIREELGMTYSPGADTLMPDFADQGSLVVRVETTPADADRVVQEVRAIAERLAKGDISAEMLEAVRQPILAHGPERMSSNAVWAGSLDGSSRDDQGLKDLVAFDGLMSAITLAEVKAAAARWLSGAPVVAIAEPADQEPKS